MGKIVFDTNVVLDVLAQREEFEYSFISLDVALLSGKDAVIPVSTVTDIYYILRKHLGKGSLDLALDAIENLFELADVTPLDYRSARMGGMEDFDDAVLSAVAERVGAEFIVTRDKGGFVASRVPAISPREFAQSFKPADYEYKLIDLG